MCVEREGIMWWRRVWSSEDYGRGGAAWGRNIGVICVRRGGWNLLVEEEVETVEVWGERRVF